MELEKIKRKAEEFNNWLIEVRRDFHLHPELGQEEYRTMQKICEYLDEMKIKYKSQVFKTGVIQILREKIKIIQ